MKYLVIFLTLSLTACGQQSKTDKSFVKDFERALDKDFNEDKLNKMFRDHSALLVPQYSAGYPLRDFLANDLYKDNIDDMLNSGNKYQRILAYLVIGSTGDQSKENVLLEKIRIETGEGNLTWAGMALFYLKTDHTTPMFDFLVKNEDFGDAHMIPLFFALNNDSLRQTAYSRIGSNDPKAKILAAQVLSVTGLNPKTEMLLKQAVKDWDINIKGYAIYSVSQLQMGNLLESLKPLLDSTQTSGIAMKALANSPTEEDRNYLKELVKKQDTVTENLLDCFYLSKNLDNVRYWLNVLCTKPVPSEYSFFVFKQPLLSSDEILPDLHIALQTIKDSKILGELVRALEKRDDNKSIEILISLLKNENKTVRYWTAKTVQRNTSRKLKTPEIQELLEKAVDRE